jgi:hypothetical protein
MYFTDNFMYLFDVILCSSLYYIKVMVYVISVSSQQQTVMAYMHQNDHVYRQLQLLQ